MYKVIARTIKSKDTYPFELEIITFDTVRQLSDAQSMMMKYIKTAVNEIYNIEIYEIVKKDIKNIFCHDKDGRMIGHESYDLESQIEAIAKDSYIYPQKSIVEVQSGDQVRLAMIGSTPFTTKELKKFNSKTSNKLTSDEMVYTVIFEETHHHIHVKEWKIRPVAVYTYDTAIEERLLSHFNEIYNQEPK